MWLWSAEAEAALSSSHTVATRVDVLHAGNPVYQLEAVGGSVGAEAGRAVLRNLSCSLVDPTGALTRGDVDDLLNPYECEIAPHRGVLLPAGAELAPLGVFGLTSRSVQDAPDGLSISLTGQDRAMNYQGPMSDSLAVSAGTPVEEAIIRLLATRNPGLQILAMVTGFTCGPLIFPPDSDVWAEAQKLAESVGGQLFHDRTGQCVFGPAGPASTSAVSAVYREGDGLLLSIDRQEDSDTIRNVVVAETPNGLIRAVVEDSDPTSPTYARGRYGRRVATLTNQHFGSVQQAQQAAAARLAYELGRSETVSFTAVPDAGRDVDELLVVHRPLIGLEERVVQVASLDVPLAADEAMRVGCRRTTISREGVVLPDLGLAA